MSIPDGLLSSSWLIPAYLLYLSLLIGALLTAPWERLKEPEQQHLIAAACVALIIFWSMRAGITPGLGLHFLGITVMTLVFGWQLALLASGVALLAITLQDLGGWGSFGINGLILGALPAFVSVVIYRSVARLLPCHLFIYIFLNAFVGAALAAMASTLLLVGSLIVDRVYSYTHVSYEYLPYLPLMLFPEAILSGMMITALVATKPQWVATFDEARCLGVDEGESS